MPARGTLSSKPEWDAQGRVKGRAGHSVLKERGAPLTYSTRTEELTLQVPTGV